MNSRERVALAAAVAIVIVVIVAAVGVFLVLSAGSHQEDLSWVPTVTPYVDDRIDLLSYDEYQDLDYFCYAVELNNSCEIAVLIVNTTQPIGINDFAIKTFEVNGIGQEGKDNGVLFVFSYSEEAWRVVTGAGVSDILSGAKLTELRQTYLDPELEAGNYSTGIVNFIYAIGLELVDNYHSEGSGSVYPISWIPLETWQWYAVIGVMVVLTIATKGRILIWIPQLIFALLGGGGKGGWGGGRTGGGGARGRF